MTSATSSRVARAFAAPRACEAMHPSHCLETLIAKAMSSLVLVSSTPSPREALWVSAKPL